MNAITLNDFATLIGLLVGGAGCALGVLNYFIERVWAVMKRGYNGVYHNWSIKHMVRYINEFAFRLNEGNCRRDTMARIDDLCCKTIGKRLTYHLLTQ